MRYARDIAKGMVWLHEAKPATIHRDLKPANILVFYLFILLLHRADCLID